MKFVSTMALGAALALGGVTAFGVLPAAAKEKAPKPPSYDLSKPVRAAVAAAQEALGKQDFATAGTKLTEAKAAATTGDDRYIIGSITYDLGQKTSSQALQAEAVDLMIASGKVSPAQLPSLYAAQGQFAYSANNYAKAEQAFDQAMKLNTTDPNIYVLMAETKARANKPAEALAVLQQAVAKQRAAGQKVPSEWYARGIGIGYQAKLADPVQQITLDWLADYPSATNWRDSLITFRDLRKLDNEYELDVMRLLRTAKGLKGERDFYEYAEAIYLKYPGEAKQVIDEGVAQGMVKLDPNGNFKMMSDAAAKRIAADKADLSGAAKAARTAATGKPAAVTADSYLGYGDYATAIDLYKVALAKGGVDTNLVNTRLGMAYAKAGQKAEAKQVFSSITGPRSGLAKYWMVWLDQQA